MKVAILGAGAWGTALALSAVPRHEVALWARDAAQAEQMRARRENTRYLPGVPLLPELAVSSDLDRVIDRASLIVLATPMAALRTMLELDAVRQAAVPVISLSKGFEAPRCVEEGGANGRGAEEGGPGLLGQEVAMQAVPDRVAGAGYGVLSGPTFALEVARGLPTAIVAASNLPAVSESAQHCFHSEHLRVYRSDDPVGVEVGGAVKNVLAIATGVSDGLALGLNARAGLVTRGLAEMSRFGVALGARLETFMGLSGLGDLVLTATGDLSRNRRVGMQLAAGRTLEDILRTLGHVAEGVYSARTVVARARHVGVEMPIAQAVVDLLDGRLTAPEAARELMQRQARAE